MRIRTHSFFVFPENVFSSYPFCVLQSSAYFNIQKYQLSSGNAMTVSSQVQFPTHLPSLARELVPSSCIKCRVLVQKPSLWTAPAIAIHLGYVATGMMLESPVWVSMKWQCSDIYSTGILYIQMILLLTELHFNVLWLLVCFSNTPCNLMLSYSSNHTVGSSLVGQTRPSAIIP